MITLRTLLRQGERELSAAGLGNSRCEARWLLEYVTGLSSASLFVSLNQVCAPSWQLKYRHLLRRRVLGEPLQHLLGAVDFYGYELTVGRGVLIPRPETECLVELALARYPGRGMVCDQCTGSGAIALVLADRLPGRPTVVGVDISRQALAYAGANRRRHRADSVHLVQSDLFKAFVPGSKFSMITANPPYVDVDELRSLPVEVRDYDPPLALLAGERGLSMVSRVVREARQHLMAQGWLLCEIGETQAAAVEQCMDECGYRNITVAGDLAGRPRIAVGQA